MPGRVKHDPHEELHYAVGKSELGSVLVATSEKGVVAILLRAEADALLDDLQARFPLAHLVRGQREEEELVWQVIQHIEAPEKELDFDLDLRGTAFQKKVWQTVRKIPLGKTSTYSEVARKVGAPRAMRAVGSACANCNLAFAIPCQRVLRSDGSKAGWAHQGMLLEREAAAAKKRRKGS